MKEYEKARQYFQTALNSAAQSSGDYGVNQSGYYEIRTAIKALEKQIPKRPINTGREIVCPTCRTLVGSSPYCRYCGQMLNHSNHPTEKGGEG